VQEINESGGVLGCQLQLELIDASGPPLTVADRVDRCSSGRTAALQPRVHGLRPGRAVNPTQALTRLVSLEDPVGEGVTTPTDQPPPLTGGYDLTVPGPARPR
jgi:hypothetical protein